MQESTPIVTLQKRWMLTPLPDKKETEQLAAELNVSPNVATLLLQRGISTFEEAKNFFRPSLSSLHDPFLMRDMDKAVERLDRAMHSQEKILIYGDYDVDGTTSVALVYNFLSQHYLNLGYYTPDRYKEGYGISYAAIDWAASEGFSLIIALDCGIKSPDHIDYAKQKGVDFIICDHHTPGEQLPKASAVLDPKRNDCSYPYKELSGCGVGFKLMQAWCIKHELSFDELYKHLDLLAISIAADIVPITGENRIFTFFGLELINHAPRPGIKALIGVAGFKKSLNISNVVFGIAPRINAAGRIDHARAAIQLLLSGNEEEARNYARLIDDTNTVRKDFDVSITEEALEMIRTDGFVKSAKSTVLYKEDWHKGVVGIVASRCIEKFYRPTIILTYSEGKVTGSARSVWGFDVYEAISKCSDLLLQFGGHKYAAGLTLKPENVVAFRERFEQVVLDSITEEQQIPRQEIDLEINLEDINAKFLRIVRQMGPFGPQNMQPVFVTNGVTDTGQVRLLKDQHLKMRLTHKNSPPLDAIAFNMPEYFERIKKGEKFNVCFTVEENEFNGQVSLQLMVRGIRFGSGY